MPARNGVLRSNLAPHLSGVRIRRTKSIQSHDILYIDLCLSTDEVSTVTALTVGICSREGVESIIFLIFNSVYPTRPLVVLSAL